MCVSVFAEQLSEVIDTGSLHLLLLTMTDFCLCELPTTLHNEVAEGKLNQLCCRPFKENTPRFGEMHFLRVRWDVKGLFLLCAPFRSSFAGWLERGKQLAQMHQKELSNILNVYICIQYSCIDKPAIDQFSFCSVSKVFSQEILHLMYCISPS